MRFKYLCGKIMEFHPRPRMFGDVVNQEMCILHLFSLFLIKNALAMK